MPRSAAPETSMHPTSSHRLLLLLASTAALVASASAQRVVLTMNGDQPGGNFGRTLALVRDIDGDGKRDLVVGEPYRDFGSVQDAGAAALISTGAWAIQYRSYGTQLGGHLGGSVAGLGDVNNDGVPDWACGAPDPVLGTGFVRVLSGATGAQLLQLTGSPFARFGASICDIGDRNLDGRADFAVGAPNASPSSPNGFVRYYSGSNGSTMLSIAGNGSTDLGASLANLGDLTGDGRPEIAIGEPLLDGNGVDAGNVLVRNPWGGAGAGFVWTAPTSFGVGQQGGGRVAALGDIDGDGKSEVLATTVAGMVVCLAGANGAVLFFVQNAEFGDDPSLTGLGDWNGDGRPDFAVGSSIANLGNGQVYVYSTGPGTPLLSSFGGGATSGFGSAVADLGDLDGDGRVEIAVGSPTYISQGLVVGRVTVHAFNIYGSTNISGTACPGQSGLQTLSLQGPANLGDTVHIQAGNLRPNAFGYLLLGFSDSNHNGLPLPASLQPFGLPCTLYVSIDSQIAYLANSLGTNDYAMTLPSTPGFAGLHFHAQYCQLDSWAVGGLSFGKKGSIRIGNL